MIKIVLQKGQKIWFTSDTHFNHKNICSATTEWDLERSKNSVRNFSSLEEMDSTIIDNINKLVGQDDILIHLGDFSFNGFDNIEKFRNRIICKNVHLILGNHDHHIKKNKNNIQNVFSSVNKGEIFLDLTYHDEDGEDKRIMFILHHYPICSWEDMSKGIIHLFGHVHLPNNKKVGPGKSMDVGVDGNNYKPYNLYEILYIMDKQPIKPTVLPSDHHSKEVK